MTKILNYKKLNKWSCVPTQLQILSNFKKKHVQSFYTFAYFSFFLKDITSTNCTLASS